MYKYLIRISVNDIGEEGRNRICDVLQQDKGSRTLLSAEQLYYYWYIEYDKLQDADNLVSTLLKIKEIQKEYPYNNQINECYIVTNILTI